MSSIKTLVKQTAWYGLSNVGGRFLNYLLTFFHVYLFKSAEYSDVSIFYANAALLSIIFAYGMETAYFRFVQKEKQPYSVYSTGFFSLAGTSILLTALILFYRQPLAVFMHIENNTEWISWLVLIVAADTLATLPFCVLRQQNKPRKYASIKLANIFITIGLQIIFFWFFPKWFNTSVNIGYVFLANLIASIITLLLLSKELLLVSWKFDKKLRNEMVVYALPLIIVGFGGIINETIDRQLILRFFDGTIEQAKSANGIYSANYKLAILIVLFIQAFRMGAEPFFFQQAEKENAPKIYARVMKFFVITCCFCFLFIVLFLDVWKLLLTTKYPEYAQGILIVPILALAKLFLGIYYNLSIWYKLTDRNKLGAWITIGGVAITVLFNVIFIPRIGYFASAFATLLCYSFMLIVSYVLGQKYYPVPYAWKKLLGYIGGCVLLFGAHRLFLLVQQNLWINCAAAFLLMGFFVFFILKIEKEEFLKIPFLKKLYAATPL